MTGMIGMALMWWPDVFRPHVHPRLCCCLADACSMLYGVHRAVCCMGFIVQYVVWGSSWRHGTASAGQCTHQLVWDAPCGLPPGRTGQCVAGCLGCPLRVASRRYIAGIRGRAAPLMQPCTTQKLHSVLIVRKLHADKALCEG
jgi:hypothetical protein